jgi:lipase chaperone LimK
MTQANENTAQILALEGVKLSASATDALDTGIDPKTYAFNKLKAEQDKRESAEPKKAIFASLATAQTPGEQADKIVKTDAQIKAEAEDFEKGMAAAAEKTFGGKK